MMMLINNVTVEVVVTVTHPVLVDDVIRNIPPRCEQRRLHRVAQELVSLGVGHVQSETDGSRPVITQHLQHLKPVGTQLRHEGDVGGRHRTVVVLEVVQVGTMDDQLLTLEFVTLVVFRQLQPNMFRYDVHILNML